MILFLRNSGIIAPDFLTARKNIIMNNLSCAKNILDGLERSKLIEIYFSRLDGSNIHNLSEEYEDILKLDISVLRTFLINQHPYDANWAKFFNLNF